MFNFINVKPKITASDIQQKINAALLRSATIDSEKITADVMGSMVTLRGHVRSYSEKEDAENAAWNAPGILSIENKLEIEGPEYAFED